MSDHTSPDLADSELLHAAADGDLGAMRELYERHAPWLTARLIRRCNDREVVLDVVQDTFVAMWRDAARWRGEGDLAAWLWGIAFRRMVSRLRRRKDVVLVPDWSSAPATLPAAEDVVLLGVEYGDLGEALRRLSPEFRAVVQACVLDGLTTREASRLLGVRQNTLKTRLHRAKAQMRASLADLRLEELG
ncbi:RNA polymerase sigma factor [Nocardioides sambongensis]|uniref:RNA polymerase sigma factor n=1 Tax=Nocardioides sambongensis TaxID=2589074 RepID=UPI0018C8A839|nr:RNA polymerase sigma factor [Nocardioides sambongensis]